MSMVLSTHRAIPFEPPGHVDTITLVGCGGTGAQIARSLGRTLYAMRQAGLQLPERVTFIDPDTIEEKNVGRQLFTVADIGQNKAQVCAARLSLALGLEIGWKAEPVTVADVQIDSGWRASPLVIGAVDNHQARQVLAQTNGIWLDCGNHHASGQVVIGNEKDRRRIVEALGNETVPYTTCLPLPSLVFPELLEAPEEDDEDAELSCAELTLRQTQHLLVNDLVALAASQYLYQLLLRQPIESFVTYVSLTPPGMRSEGISRTSLTPYL